jgi:hypothetical protein
MANWKKVIVSGSIPSFTDIKVDGLASNTVVLGGGSGSVLTTQARNGTGNIVGTTAADGVSMSGSFSGSFQGTINADIASASIADTAGTASVALRANSLAPTVTATSASVAARATTLSPAATASFADSATTASHALSGAGDFSGSFIGDGSGLTGITHVLDNSLTDGNGIADFTFNGSAGASVAVQADGSTLTVGASGVKVADAGITATQLNTSVAGDGLAGGGGTALSVNVDDSSIETNSDSLRVKASGITNDMLAGSIANAKLSNSSVTVGSTEIALGATSTTLAGLTNVVGTKFSGSFSGSFEGDGAGLTGIATTLTVDADSGGTSTVDLKTQTFDIAGTANEIETSVSGQTVTIGLPNNVTIGQDLTVTRDAVITRNLTVQGTASFQATTDLDVADRFIRLASGSNAAGEGGFVVQQGDNGLGEVFGYDQTTLRFGLSSSFDATQNSFTPDAFFSNVIEGDANDPTATIAKYTKKGNIFVADNGDIHIYS